MMQYVRSSKGSALAIYAGLLGLIVVGMVVLLSNFSSQNEWQGELRQGEINIITTLKESSPLLVKIDTRLSDGFHTGFFVSLDGRSANLVVNWGDGTPEEFLRANGPITYRYASPGEYNVQIWGDFTQFGMSGLDVSIPKSLTRVISWGSAPLSSLKEGFAGTENLEVLPVNLPQSVNDISGLLRGSGYNGVEIGAWNTSRIVDFSDVFSKNEKFNQNISFWNTSQSLTMAGMFEGAISFNQDISTWNVSRVENFSNMFKDSFFSRDIGTWNVSSSQIMRGMFENNPDFNHDLNKWDVVNVVDFSSMFKNAKAFQLSNIDDWRTEYGENFDEMFYATFNAGEGLQDWNVERMISAQRMFSLSSFSGDISRWNTSQLKTAESMFEAALLFNADISAWNVGSVENFSRMFSKASRFTSDLSRWNVSRSRDFSGMFEEALMFESDVSRWRVSSEITRIGLSEMFLNAQNFSSDLRCWDIPLVSQRPLRFSDGTLDVQDPAWGSGRPAFCAS